MFTLFSKPTAPGPGPGPGPATAPGPVPGPVPSALYDLLNKKQLSGFTWNRDRNGSSNIYKIAENAINKLERPSYLCRETRNHPLLTSVG